MITKLKEGFSYASALKEARESISLDELNIEKTKIRRAANGSMLIEIMGHDGVGKAIALKRSSPRYLRIRLELLDLW